jgi:hypothetical protein
VLAPCSASAPRVADLSGQSHQALIHGHTVLFTNAGQLLGDLADINAAKVARSQRLGHVQSKSQTALKRPIWASWRRRSRLRRARSCSSDAEAEAGDRYSEKKANSLMLRYHRRSDRKYHPRGQNRPPRKVASQNKARKCACRPQSQNGAHDDPLSTAREDRQLSKLTIAHADSEAGLIEGGPKSDGSLFRKIYLKGGLHGESVNTLAIAQSSARDPPTRSKTGVRRRGAPA